MCQVPNSTNFKAVAYQGVTVSWFHCEPLNLEVPNWCKEWLYLVDCGLWLFLARCFGGILLKSRKSNLRMMLQISSASLVQVSVCIIHDLSQGFGVIKSPLKRIASYTSVLFITGQNMRRTWRSKVNLESFWIISQLKIIYKVSAFLVNFWVLNFKYLFIGVVLINYHFEDVF